MRGTIVQVKLAVGWAEEAGQRGSWATLPSSSPPTAALTPSTRPSPCLTPRTSSPGPDEREATWKTNRIRERCGQGAIFGVGI